jgi:hypothetical protein
LKIVNIKEKTAVEARATASLETILIPFGGGEIKEDLIVCEDMPLVVGAEQSIKQKPVTIANRRSPESDELLKAIAVRYYEPPHMECLRDCE